jgi:hypothetical protein
MTPAGRSADGVFLCLFFGLVFLFLPAQLLSGQKIAVGPGLSPENYNILLGLIQVWRRLLCALWLSARAPPPSSVSISMPAVSAD